MNLKYLGSVYGGWVVDLDLINNGDFIISGGIGEDISFDVSLLRERDVRIIAIDPTIKSHQFMESQNIPGIELIKAAITKDNGEIVMYKNTNPLYVSESINKTHQMVGEETHIVRGISMKELISEYQPSYIKIDIEGAEYDVLLDCIGIKQISVEFHHHCMESYNLNDTVDILNTFTENGYKIISNRGNYQEITMAKYEN